LSASVPWIRRCSPGFKSWEEEQDGKITQLALLVMRNYYTRKRKKHPSSADIDWRVVAEQLTGKKIA